MHTLVPRVADAVATCSATPSSLLPAPPQQPHGIPPVPLLAYESLYALLSLTLRDRSCQRLTNVLPTQLEANLALNLTQDLLVGDGFALLQLSNHL